MKFYTTALLLSFFTASINTDINAQNGEMGCGTPDRDTTEFLNLPWIGNNDTLQFLLDSLDIDNPLRSTNNVYFRIPIKVWIHRHSDGSGGITLLKVRNWLHKTNELFDDNNCGHIQKPDFFQRIRRIVSGSV
jgi:hypothetical protein